MWAWRDTKEGRALAMHVADSSLIPGIAYGLLRLSGMIPKHRARALSV